MLAGVLGARPNQPREGFDDNRTVFGAILRGDLPTTVLYEDERVLCFRDIRPVSKHHSLVIPKRNIRDLNHLGPEDVPLLRHMVSVAKAVVTTDCAEITDAAAALAVHQL